MLAAALFITCALTVAAAAADDDDDGGGGGGGGDARIANLLAWFREECQGYISASVEIREDAHYGGFAVFTTAALEKHEEVVRVPDDCIITADVVLANPTIGEFIDMDVENILGATNQMALYLLVEKHRGNQSRWFHYINALPKSFSTPLFFSSMEMELLTGSNVQSWAQKRNAAVMRHHDSIKDLVASIYKDFAAFFTLDQFRWALSIVWSRSFAVYIDGKRLPSLVPVADMLNNDLKVINVEGLTLPKNRSNVGAQNNGVGSGQRRKEDRDITLRELNDVNNRWISLHGKVYDVSSFIEKHPGGDAILLRHLNMDATAEFESIGHSEHAALLLEGFHIGALATRRSTTQEIPPLPREPSEFVLRAADRVAKHVQLFGQYSKDAANFRLLLDYGFVYPANDNDVFVVDVMLLCQDAKQREFMQKAIEMFNLNEDAFGLTRLGVPGGLVMCLRAMALFTAQGDGVSQDDEDKLFEGKEISTINELMAMNALVHLVDHYLRQFTVMVAPSTKITANIKNIQTLIEGDKYILGMAKAWAKDRIKHLST